MSDFIKTLPQHHEATNNKVSSANTALFSHPDYEKIKGTKFEHGTIDQITKETSLNYSTPDGFTEEQILLAEKIVKSLTF